MTDLHSLTPLICLTDRDSVGICEDTLSQAGCLKSQTAEDLNEVKDILSTAEINLLVIECSEVFVNHPKELHRLTHKFKNIRVILVIKQNYPVQEAFLKQYQQIANAIINEPLEQKQLLACLKESSTPDKQPSVKQEVKSPPSRQAVKLLNPEPELQSNEVWELLFTDSNKAQIIVKAENQKVTHVNQALCELLQTDKSTLVGKKWFELDIKENQASYSEYTRELTVNEKTSFQTSFPVNGKIEDYNVEYQTGILNSEIVYHGYINNCAQKSVSDEIFDLIEQIQSTDVLSTKATVLFEEIRNFLAVDFLLFFEFNNNKLLKPSFAGDTKQIIDFIKANNMELLKLMKSAEEVIYPLQAENEEISIHMLDGLKFKSFGFFPIVDSTVPYGAIVVGSKLNKVDWLSTRFVINNLVGRCKFKLFQKKIIEQKEMEGMLDKLTGLPNRNAATKKFAELNKHGVEDDKYISLMIINLHKLNVYNKSLGIDLTNQLLRSFSQLISKTVRSAGVTYRLSGDEFMIMLNPHDEKSRSEALAKALIKSFSQPILMSSGEEEKVDVNIGISIFPDEGQTVSSMMKNADLAMYDAKLSGRNNFVIFKFSETGKALQKKIQMEENLKKAIRDNHIKVFYQPKIDALSEDIIGFEALVRWIDPTLGMINPGHFIPLAEETGLVNEIGEFIIQTVCKKLIQWQNRFNLNLNCSINVSPVQLKDKTLPKKIEKIINSTGIMPGNIDFEITETIDINSVPNLVETLNAIVKTGCTLSIDDFGTGHSSLDYVKKIPATFIKIDQTFVANIGLDPEDEAILDATIGIAKRLNRKLIAEGVETEEQREYLLERNCEYFQGFLFSRPLPENEIDRILQEKIELMG
jgi:diguanylate cyclase (GGDEF)-like protein